MRSNPYQILMCAGVTPRGHLLVGNTHPRSAVAVAVLGKSVGQSWGWVGAAADPEHPSTSRL